MASQQIIDYINQEIKLGVSRENIEKDLTAIGWQVPDITDAFNSLPESKDSALQNQVIKEAVIENHVIINSEPKVNSSKSPKNLKKILMIIGVIFVGLALVGGVVFAYFSYFQSPEKNIEKMFNNLSNIKAMAYSGELKVSANTPETPVTTKKLSNLLLTFEGASDTQNLDDIKGLFSFQIKTDAVEGQEFSIGLEIRSLSKMLFLKLSNLPNLGFIDLGFLNNKWIKLEESMLNQGSTASSSKEIDNNLVKEKAIKLKNLFAESKIVKISETLKNEKIEGQDTYHYKYVIDKEALKKFTVDSALILTNEALTAEQIASSTEQINKIDLIEGEIWIGKSDFMPYKLTFNVKAKDETNLSAENQANLVLFFKNFNSPVKIEAPQDAKSITELLGGLMGAVSFGSEGDMFGVSSTTIGTSSIPQISTEDMILMEKDSDSDGLNDYEEINVYKTDPYNSDTDVDGFPDGQEVKGGYNPTGEGKLVIEVSSSTQNILDVLENSRIKARNAKRISDIKQIQIALEMYYNEMNYYPSVKEFASKSIKTESTVYMAVIPEAPLPIDGTCVDKEGSNRYTYKTDGKGTTYTLTYCLGDDVGTIGAGVNTASEKGIYFK